jgi:hypothetical protein
MMIQLSQTADKYFYLDFSATNYGQGEYTFNFTSLSTDETTSVVLQPVSYTGRAYKFYYGAAALFPGQYLVSILFDDSDHVTTVTAYVQGSTLVSGGNFTEYQSTNTTKYFEG